MADARRRSFGPVVLAGLASAGLAAVAGNRDWAEPDQKVLDDLGMTATTAQMPLFAALSLVVLACWGVLLVTRGRVRRFVAGLGVVASLALLVTSVTGWSAAPESLRDALQLSTLRTTHTIWYWAGLLAAVVSLLATAAAVRLVPAWPEMGSRYDAPGSAPPSEQTDLDLWRALDDGRDPTLHERERTDP